MKGLPVFIIFLLIVTSFLFFGLHMVGLLELASEVFIGLALVVLGSFLLISMGVVTAFSIEIKVEGDDEQ